MTTIDDLINRNRLGNLVNLVGDGFGGRSTVAHVVLDTEVIVGSTGVV